MKHAGNCSLKNASLIAFKKIALPSTIRKKCIKYLRKIVRKQKRNKDLYQYNVKISKNIFDKNLVLVPKVPMPNSPGS